MRRAIACAAFLAIAACSAEEGEPAPVEDRPAAQIDRDATVEHERIGAKAQMLLLSSGFAYRVAGGTSTEEIGFGIRRETVERIARQQFGEPTAQTVNEECGAGPMSFTEYGPLTFNFQEGRLVGWYVEAGGEITTADGVKPGATGFDFLAAERAASMVEDSTLDGEFRYTGADDGEVGGFVDEAGTVRALYAGTNCFFR